MRFMVEGTAKQALTDEQMTLLPAETARGLELEAQGLRTAIYVDATFSRVWQVFTADTQEEVQRALETLPLYDVTAYTITPLADPQ